LISRYKITKFISSLQEQYRAKQHGGEVLGYKKLSAEFRNSICHMKILKAVQYLELERYGDHVLHSLI
jgi:hypothetical protein